MSDVFRKSIDHRMGRGGIKCHCCKPANGSKAVYRAEKRHERQEWKKKAEKEVYEYFEDMAQKEDEMCGLHRLLTEEKESNDVLEDSI